MKKHLLLFSLLFSFAIVNAQSSGYVKQDFEMPRFPPAGWSTINIKGTNVWGRTTTFAHEGTACAFSSFSFPNKGINYLITKQFTVTAGDSVTFWFAPEYTGYTDSLYVQVSTTHTSPKDFTTIATYYDGYNYPPAAGIWQRVALSLSAYAGQKIYVAFKHVDIDGDGIFIDDVALGTPPAADIKAVSIDVPSILSAGTTITPQASFQNIGSQTQTFNVTLTAGTYTSTKTVTALDPQNTAQITFDNLTLPATYTPILMTAYSTLAGDADPTNDTVWKQTNVYTSFPNNGWVIAKSLPAAVFGNAVTSCYMGTSPNDTAYIFSIGGSNNSRIVGTTMRFDVKAKKWKKMAAMPTPRYGGSAFTFNGKIYYLGGYSAPFSPTSEVSIYDIATDTWSDGAPMPYAIGDYAGCQYQDSLLYVIGGYDGLADQNTVYVYNAGKDKWNKCTKFPGIASDGNRAGIVNNTIITVGGYSQSKGKLLSESYQGVIDPSNPRNITWTQIANYPSGPTSRLGATGVKNSKTSLVYFTGGFDSAEAAIGKKATWAYDVNAQAWEAGPDKPTGVSNISGFSPFVFKDTLYIASIGGFDGLNVVNVNEWLKLGATSEILPVHLLSFNATLQKNGTLLSWKVAEDGTGGYYIIQRSADAVHFTDMPGKTDAGRISAVKTYTGYDLLPLKGYNYYRIKISNADGSIAYSEIKAVNYNAVNPAVFALNIYPNPTNAPLNILLQNNSGSSALIGIAISDASGKKIVNETKTADASLSLNYKLKPGVYIVNVTSQDGTFKESRKVIVE